MKCFKHKEHMMDSCAVCVLEARRDGIVEGIKEGIRAYAWWKDGVQYVGTCGTTLKRALKDVDNKKYPHPEW